MPKAALLSASYIPVDVLSRDFILRRAVFWATFIPVSSFPGRFAWNDDGIPVHPVSHSNKFLFEWEVRLDTIVKLTDAELLDPCGFSLPVHGYHIWFLLYKLQESRVVWLFPAKSVAR